MSELIIVCGNKYLEYANMLLQLISDSYVTAAIYSEKQYVESTAKIPSKQPVLFIGEGKTIDGQKRSMKTKFSKFGMNYCIGGKRAILNIDRKITDIEYTDFLTFTRKYDLDFLQAKAEANKNLKTGEIWTNPKYAIPPLDLITVAGVTRRQQYQCLIKVFFVDFLSSFVASNNG